MQKAKYYMIHLFQNRFFQHLIGIIAFILFEWLFILQGATGAKYFVIGLFYVFEIGFFYLLVYLVLPFADKQKFTLLFKFIIVVITLLIASVIYSLYYRWMCYVFDYPYDKSKILYLTKVSFLRMFYISIGAFIIWYVRRSFENKIAYYKLVEKNDKLEIALLRSQLNPHLLFNVLSAVQNKLTDRYPETKMLMYSLTDIFELAMKGSKPENISTLDQEIRLIEKMVFLYDELGKSAALSIDVSDELRSTLFPPKLLASLVENVYKHGAFASSDPSANITLTAHDGFIYFATQNSKMDVPSTTSNLIGLTNTRLSLDRYFPDRYKLTIDTVHPTLFSVNLFIKLM